MEATWNRLQGQLSVANGEDFERIALHYLRISWPSMIQAPRMQRLDRFGVDLCVPESNSHFNVVVQAKGFKVDEQLLKSQVDNQVLPSIDKFRRSPLTCDKYFLLHNRDGSDRQLAGIIQVALDELVAQGKAKSVQLWDRHSFIKEVRSQINSRIRDKLSNRSRNLLRQHGGIFHFGGLFISQVPLRHTIWKPGSSVQEEFAGSDFVTKDAARLIASARKVRYALLIGSFGIGKTTTTLRAVDTKDMHVIYVPAHTIRREHGSQGTNYLLRNLNDELDLLDDLPADTAEVVRDLMGAALGRVLRQPNNQFVLVIDGLDEHNFYGTPFGLSWLTNELSELQCSIVLTTRREHFLSLIGNYELAAQTLSKKGGAERTVDVFELGSWSSTQALELLQSARNLIQRDDQVSSICRLIDKFTSDSSALSTRLLNHPLFLQMTLDLIMDGEDWAVDDEDRLIELWSRKKIQRDLSVPRLNSDLRIDVEYYVDSMMDSMTSVALAMRSSNADTQAQSETIEAEKVLAIVRDVMAMHELDLTTILTTSLLVPATRRRGRILEVKFFHRALQEFFGKRGSTSAQN